MCRYVLILIYFYYAYILTELAAAEASLPARNAKYLNPALVFLTGLPLASTSSSVLSLNYNDNSNGANANEFWDVFAVCRPCNRIILRELFVDHRCI